MEISKTLFVVNPDDKFLCSYHGGLMDTPYENSTCLHCFCSFCIETLTNCPIDNMPITNISINEQLKDEFDQLLCYCKYGIEVNEFTGEVTTKVNGCNCLISYGGKEAHESICKFNENKSPTISDFYEMKFSSDGLSSTGGFSSPSSTNNSSPKSNNSSSSSTSKSPSFEQISLQQKQQQQQMVKQNSPIQLSSTNNNNNNNNAIEDYFDKNALWESSTSLFFCNRYCPNKELGCCYSGKTEQDIYYHLEIECFCQKMKEKIIELESKVEEKEMEIISLRKSTSSILLTNNEKPSNNKIVGKTTPSPTNTSPLSLSSSSTHNNESYTYTYTHSPSDSNKQIQTFTISKIFIIFFDILRKGIKKSFKKVKKFFKRKNSNSPYKNFIKIK